MRSGSEETQSEKESTVGHLDSGHWIFKPLLAERGSWVLLLLWKGKHLHWRIHTLTTTRERPGGTPKEDRVRLQAARIPTNLP